MLDRDELSIRICTLRLARGLDRPELAARLGCTTTAVRYWEVGKGTPNLHFMRALRNEFGEPLYATAGAQDIRELPNNIVGFIEDNCMWRGWSQSRLARRLGVSRQAVNELLKRARVTNSMTWERYAKIKKLFDAYPVLDGATP